MFFCSRKAFEVFEMKMDIMFKLKAFDFGQRLFGVKICIYVDFTL